MPRSRTHPLKKVEYYKRVQAKAREEKRASKQVVIIPSIRILPRAEVEAIDKELLAAESEIDLLILPSNGREFKM